jgi:hypothetical protein
LLALLALAPVTGSVSRAQQQTVSPPFPFPDASNRSPSDRHADDPADDLIKAKRLKELNILRQKQITTDAAKLLALATELKSNLDKSHDPAATPDLMHKAEQIEKLAHSVRAKMTDAAAL